MTKRERVRVHDEERDLHKTATEQIRDRRECRGEPGGLPQTGPPKERVPEIPVLLDVLDDTIKALGQETDELIRRLEPVLMPASDEPMPGLGPQVTCTQLGAEVSGRTSRLAELVQVVRGLHGRLAL
jgi:hypothetical protein